MKLGQTSIVYFLSRFLASFLGFIATIYFARLLGAEPLGIYYLVIGLVSWLAIAGKIGFSGAVKKRVSEGEEQEEYAIAGMALITAIFVIISVGILLFRPYVDSYIGYPATEFVVLFLFVTLSNAIVNSLLVGFHLVHVNGILSPTRTGGRVILQIGAVVAGLGLTGLFVGYVAGYAVVVLIGLSIALRRFDGFSLPQRRHFRSLFDYAKFSWLGSLQSRMFNYTDVIVLGIFVPSTLIGVYSIAWNVAQFLILFAGAISTTFFPEISELSSKRNTESVTDLVENALSYSGLLLIPGLVGGTIIGERLLRIYGEEFIQGTTILVVLIIANLIMSYQSQILNTLNAIDRPDLAFRANVVFVVGNLFLNVLLIYFYGWFGAAVATALSIAISLVVAHHYLQSIVDYAIPYTEISRQWIAAIVMGVIVYGGVHLENTYAVLGHNVATVILLVGIGASVYFVTLLGLSPRFRTTVDRNLPFNIPLARN
ncbi:flippase [Haloterrigena alkaliphila]|uniref:Flippase n=1 Tax=Haloterrigena alkaliphila TaxID=2816475 RepID=A0A8A2VG16_9EURY|nr:flippase [Haloterrigena alkaliphila]QSW99640.1 flippase [Haloterrigena alkaliphila]